MATSSIVQPSNIFPTNPLPDVIETGLLTSEEAMELLHAYRTNSVNFPFVPLRDNFDLSHIRRYRPVLFIGALTMACQQNKRRQLALDLAFREVLSRKVIMEGQRNLDLLEGLMVYLSG